MSLFVLADWSHLDKNANRYRPIDALLQQVARQQEIDAMLVIGDVGYDLDTNNCRNYEEFLVMLGLMAQRVPVIMITGNHEYNTQDNYLLYTQSFEMYGVDTEMAVALNLGALRLLAFDTYPLLYKKVTPAQDKTLPLFTALLAEAVRTGQFVLPSSHYPLACSGTSANCKNDRRDMQPYWEEMIDSGVSLYIGAHYHTYQRLFPYLRNGSFSTQQDHYTSDGDYLITIVEGVAGNDKDIVEKIDTIEGFTAAYTVNETGFAVLKVTQ